MEFEIGLELAESPTKIVNDLEKILLNKMTIIANKLCGVVLVYMIRNIYDMLLISDVGQDFALELKLYGLIGIAYCSILVWGIGGTAIIFSIYKRLTTNKIIK